MDINAQMLETPGVEMEDTAEGLKVRLPSGSRLVGLMMIGMCALVALLVVLLVPSLFAGGLDASLLMTLPIAVVSLALLVPVVAMGGYLAFGKEEVVVTGATLRIRRSLLGRGQWYTYNVPEIRNLRMDREAFRLGMIDPTPKGIRRGLGWIMFNYGKMGVFRIGMGIGKEDAKRLTETLKQRIAPQPAAAQGMPSQPGTAPMSKPFLPGVTPMGSGQQGPGSGFGTG